MGSGSLKHATRPAGPAPAGPVPPVQRSRQKPRAAAGRPLFGEIQTRLEVGAVDDPLELEAERAAERVMRDTSRPSAAPRGDAAVRRASAKTTAEQAEDEAEHEASKRPMHVARSAAPAHDGPKAHAIDASVERAIDGLRGTGHALDPETRSFMEESFGRSFESVRVHDSTVAGTTARALEARAFTSGNDIVFGPGEYGPHGDEGRMLLAHELAHVVQQSDGRQGLGRVHRARDKAPKASDALRTSEANGETVEDPLKFIPKTSKKDGWIEIDAATGKGTMHLPELGVPKLQGDIKGSAHHKVAGLEGMPAKGKNPLERGQPFTYLGGTERSSTSARQRWLTAAAKELSSNLESRLADKLKTSRKAGTVPDRAGHQVYYLRLAGARSPVVLNGGLEELSRNENLLIPVWDTDGKIQFFDVDHAHELQLGGEDGWTNFSLLDRTANQRSGGSIYRHSLKGPVERLIELASIAESPFWVKGRGGKKAPTIDVIREKWTIAFDRVAEFDIGINNAAYWTKEQIKGGAQLEKLAFMTKEELADQGLSPDRAPKHFSLFMDELGGFRKLLPVEEGVVDLPRSKEARAEFYKGFSLETIEIKLHPDVMDGRRIGKLSGTVFREPSKGGRNFVPAHIDLDIIQSKRLGFGGLIDKKKLDEERRELLAYVTPFSPVEIEDAGFQGDALYARGRIKADKALFKGLEIPFLILGDEIQLEFPIPVDALKLGPLQVTQAALTLGMSKGDFAYGGYIAFQVARLGSGMLEAEKLDLKGRFDFDTDLFKPASVEVSYINDQLSAAAKLGLSEGKVPGLSSAVLAVAMGPQGVSLEGTAQLAIPALQGTTLMIGWSPETGLTIGADDIPLPVSSIPGVQSAMASIHVKENPKTGALEVSGGGTAMLAVPGATGSIGVEVEGAGLTISGEAAIARGILNGNLQMTVTNLPIDEAGNPVEGEPGPHMTAFGRGQATVQFGPILRGTVGLELTPDGQMQLSGGIALPPVVDVFDERKYDKELFKSPAIDIPIIGFSALGHRVGIFFTLGGSLGFEAAVGPGQLRDTRLDVEYNPDQPEKAHIAGGAHFVVPAHAGLVLEVHGALAAGIPVVDAEAGVRMKGNLGITGEASADVVVDWTPASGLVLDAKAEIKASPRFRIDIDAYLNVSLDLLLKTVELYDKEWELTSFEFGPALEVGVSLPVHWDETNGLALSTDQIQIHKPDIDILDMAKNLFHEIV